MFGLDVDTLRNIRRAIAKFPNVEKVLIYGSRAKGNYKAGSDIDITLIGKKLTIQNTIYPLMDEIDNLYLPYQFDISIFNQLKDSDFVEHVLRVGKIFYRKENNTRKGWKEATIGKVCKILDHRRKPITKRNRIAGPYPYYGATGIVDYVDGYVFDEPLVLVGEDGAKWGEGENSAFAVSGKCWVNNHAHVLRPNRDILLDNWLIYYLNQSDLTSFITGLTVPKLNQNKLCEIAIPIPPIHEQERIVAILDDAVSAIATATTNIEKNLANAQELFESQLEHVFTGDALNERWILKNLDDICEIARGGSPRPIKEFITNDSDGINWIKISDATASTKYIYETKQKIKPEGIHRSRMVQDGDLLLSNSMSFGRPYIMKTSGCIHDGWLVLSDKAGLFTQDYLYHFLGSNTAYRQFDSRASGSTVRNLNIDLVRSVKIPLPPLYEQQRIAAFLDKLSAEKQSLVSVYENKIHTLKKLKQSLLHQAFTGELTRK